MILGLINNSKHPPLPIFFFTYQTKFTQCVNSIDDDYWSEPIRIENQLFWRGWITEETD